MYTVGKGYISLTTLSLSGNVYYSSQSLSGNVPLLTVPVGECNNPQTCCRVMYNSPHICYQGRYHSLQSLSGKVYYSSHSLSGKVSVLTVTVGVGVLSVFTFLAVGEQINPQTCCWGREDNYLSHSLSGKVLLVTLPVGDRITPHTRCRGRYIPPHTCCWGMYQLSNLLLGKVSLVHLWVRWVGSTGMMAIH